MYFIKKKILNKLNVFKLFSIWNWNMYMFGFKILKNNNKIKSWVIININILLNFVDKTIGKVENIVGYVGIIFIWRYW